MLQFFPASAVFSTIIRRTVDEFELQNTIKVERAKRNLTQAELATAVGVSRKTINTIETGKFVPSTITALRISIVLKLPVEEVFRLHRKSGQAPALHP